MASLWDTMTGNRQNASAEQLKREDARQAAEAAARRKAEREAADRADAERAVKAITFKRGGAVKKAVPVQRMVVKAKPKTRR